MDEQQIKIYSGERGINFENMLRKTLFYFDPEQCYKSIPDLFSVSDFSLRFVFCPNLWYCWELDF